jgi:hypothetical protein
MQGGGGAPLVPAGMATAACISWGRRDFEAGKNERTTQHDTANQATMCGRSL